MTYIAKAKNGLFTKKELNAMGQAAAKKYAKAQGIARAKHVSENQLTDQPICTTKKCKNPCVVFEWHWTSGKPVYRKFCSRCHEKRTAEKHGLKRIRQVVAKNAGFSSETEYANSIHPYLKYRKDYCENIDSRLGFKCTTNIFWNGMLEVDHINGNPRDHRESNLQTLCKCCHAWKTNFFKDYKTPGRKTLAK